MSNEWKVGVIINIPPQALEEASQKLLMQGGAIELLAKPPPGLAWILIDDGEPGMSFQLIKLVSKK